MKKLLLILSVIVIGVPFLALATTPQFQVDPGGTLTTGLVSYYNMQGNSNDYWGTYNGSGTSVTYGTSYGKVNEGASFNGSSYISQTSFPYSLQAYSWSVWVQKTSTKTTNSYVMNAGGGAGTFFFFMILDVSGTNGKADIGGGKGSSGNVDVFSTFNLSNNTWYNIVGTFDGTQTWNLYINGVLNNSGTYNPSGASAATGITYGASDPGDANKYVGNIDEIGIWSKVLSSTEISDLYNGGSGQTMCNGTGGPVCATGSSPVMQFNWITFKPEHFTFA
jgi:hypothetical protein